MLLAIDVGNSHIVIGCIDGKTIRHVFRMVTDAAKTVDEYTVSIDGVLRFHGMDAGSFDGAILSSVVPQLGGVIRDAIQKLTGNTAMMVGAGMKTGLNILIENPAELASDMVATAVAAVAKYPSPVFIVDMGTATKITVINASGSYVGGAICPGVALSADTLSTGAALLPKVSIEAPKKAVCGDTVGAMRSGIVFGAAAMVDGMIRRFNEELGLAASVVATGGLASRVIPHCREKIVYDENLILDGLRILYEKNIK